MGKILVVDDVGFIRHRITNVLTRAGYTVSAADDGQLGLEMLRQDTRVSLVLTDGPMRRCSGLELMWIAQSLERHDDQGVAHAPKVVLMTTPGKLSGSGQTDWYHPDRAVSYGFSAVLCKPFKDTELLRCVQELRRGKSQPVIAAKPQELCKSSDPAASPASNSAASENQQAYHSLKRLIEEQMTILNNITK